MSGIMYGYARVSTRAQNEDRQLAALKEFGVATKDIVVEKQSGKLRAVFPECFAEGRLDIDKLLSLCGEYVSDDFEKYEFPAAFKVSSVCPA